jgi:hypothetical protein
MYCAFVSRAPECCALTLCIGWDGLWVISGCLLGSYLYLICFWMYSLFFLYNFLFMIHVSLRRPFNLMSQVRNGRQGLVDSHKIKKIEAHIIYYCLCHFWTAIPHGSYHVEELNQWVETPDYILVLDVEHVVNASNFIRHEFVMNRRPVK